MISFLTDFFNTFSTSAPTIPTPTTPQPLIYNSLDIDKSMWGSANEFETDLTNIDAKLSILNSKTKPYDWMLKSDDYSRTGLLVHLGSICKLTAAKMRILSFTGNLPGSTVEVFVPKIKTETECAVVGKMFIANMAAHGFVIDEFYLMHKINKGCELEYPVPG